MSEELLPGEKIDFHPKNRKLNMIAICEWQEAHTAMGDLATCLYVQTFDMEVKVKPGFDDAYVVENSVRILERNGNRVLALVPPARELSYMRDGITGQEVVSNGEARCKLIDVMDAAEKTLKSPKRNRTLHVKPKP